MLTLVVVAVAVVVVAANVAVLLFFFLLLFLLQLWLRFAVRLVAVAVGGAIVVAVSKLTAHVQS